MKSQSFPRLLSFLFALITFTILSGTYYGYCQDENSEEPRLITTTTAETDDEKYLVDLAKARAVLHSLRGDHTRIVAWGMQFVQERQRLHSKRRRHLEYVVINLVLNSELQRMKTKLGVDVQTFAPSWLDFVGYHNDPQELFATVNQAVENFAKRDAVEEIPVPATDVLADTWKAMEGTLRAIFFERARPEIIAPHAPQVSNKSGDLTRIDIAKTHVAYLRDVLRFFRSKYELSEEIDAAAASVIALADEKLTHWRTKAGGADPIARESLTKADIKEGLRCIHYLLRTMDNVMDERDTQRYGKHWEIIQYDALVGGELSRIANDF